MQVYRIAKCNLISDLTGQGAFLYGGRWNSKGTRILYTSGTSSLAMLESVAHGIMPGQDYCVVTLSIPDDKIRELKRTELPPGWNENPAPEHLKRTGDDFIREGKYLALKLPSVVNQHEFNYLLNPAHNDFRKVKILSTEAIAVDKRLLAPKSTRKKTARKKT